MNTMFGFLDRIQVQKEPGPEQYLGEDGLIYCGKWSYAGSMPDHI